MVPFPSCFSVHLISFCVHHSVFRIQAFSSVPNAHWCVLYSHLITVRPLNCIHSEQWNRVDSSPASSLPMGFPVLGRRSTFPKVPSPSCLTPTPPSAAFLDEPHSVTLTWLVPQRLWTGSFQHPQVLKHSSLKDTLGTPSLTCLPLSGHVLCHVHCRGTCDTQHQCKTESARALVLQSVSMAFCMNSVFLG